MIHSFSDFVSLSVTAVWVYPFIQAIIDRNVNMAFIPFAAWLVTLATSVIKKSTEVLFPETTVFHRPAGASNCDLWNRGGFVGGAPGFPSGHTATASFLATVLFYDTPMWAKISAAAWVLLVGVSRVLKTCHTVPQVVAGAILGVICGIGYKAVV